MILDCTLAAALALTACSRSDSGSSGSMSTNMGGSSSQTGQAGQNAAYRTGLGILTEASDQERAGKIDTIAAAVLLDAEGRVADVMLDEVEISVTGDSTGKVTMPTDDRTKRQKGDDYPLAAVSSLKKGWAEQADAFGNYLTGKTPDEVKKLATDDDGKPKDADLLSTCTIAVDGYRDAVVRACENAKAVGSARGDRAVLGVSVRNDTKELTADDDHDVTAQVDITVAALTLDADSRVTGAVADVAEPALTVGADGTVSAPEMVTSDVLLASASQAIIYGFNVRPNAKVRQKAEEEGIEIRLHNIIYKMVEEIETAMKGMLAPEIKEVVTGQAEIRQVIKVSKVGNIAGCYVTDGFIRRNCGIRLLRDSVVVYEGKLGSLKRFQDDAKEVAAGFECGLSIENFNDIKEGDNCRRIYHGRSRS